MYLVEEEFDVALGAPAGVLVVQPHPGEHLAAQEAPALADLLGEPAGPVLAAEDVAQVSAVEVDLRLEHLEVGPAPHLQGVVTVARAARGVEVLRVVDAVGEE